MRWNIWDWLLLLKMEREKKSTYTVSARDAHEAIGGSSKQKASERKREIGQKQLQEQQQQQLPNKPKSEAHTETPKHTESDYVCARIQWTTKKTQHNTAQQTICVCYATCERALQYEIFFDRWILVLIWQSKRTNTRYTKYKLFIQFNPFWSPRKKPNQKTFLRASASVIVWVCTRAFYVVRSMMRKSKFWKRKNKQAIRKGEKKSLTKRRSLTNLSLRRFEWWNIFWCDLIKKVSLEIFNQDNEKKTTKIASGRKKFATILWWREEMNRPHFIMIHQDRSSHLNLFIAAVENRNFSVSSDNV